MLTRFAAALALSLVAAVVHATESRRWQVVRAADRKVGQALVTRIDDGVRILEREQIQIEFGREGRRVHYELTLESESTRDGTFVRTSREVATSESRTRVEARAAGDDLSVLHGAGGSESAQVLAGAARGLRTEESAREWLAAVGRGETRPPFVYRSWDPVKLAVVDVLLTARPGDVRTNVERRVRAADDETASLLHASRTGDIVREIVRMDAFSLERADATEAEALAHNEAFDHLAPSLTKSPYRIPTGDLQLKIRYRFDNGGRSVTLPEGAGQRAWSEGPTTWIQVCPRCPLDAHALGKEERAGALAASRWIESTDAEIVERARRIAQRSDDPVAKMNRLTSFVREHMDPRVDMLGYGTALEALRTRRGDCTEYAVLLAAFGRAAGIPTRIAIGRVYSRRFAGERDVFVPHAWVQAWTGSGWQSFDAGTGSFDSSHLAFALSYDGSPATHARGLALSRELTLVGAARVEPRVAPAAQ